MKQILTISSFQMNISLSDLAKDFEITIDGRTARLLKLPFLVYHEDKAAKQICQERPTTQEGLGS
jgi:hypothetical protein